MRNLLAGIVILTVSCGKLPPVPLTTLHQIADDRRPIQKPKEASDLKYGEVTRLNTFDRVAPISDVRTYGKAIGNALGGNFGREAQNINLFDDVADSTWFTHRHARRRLTREELVNGPTRERLAQEGTLKVISGKSSGVTPGFVVEDTNQNRFLLKFDPPSHCGLASGADVVSSRIFWAAGFNVPENNVESIDLTRLQVDPKAKTRNAYNEKVPLTEERLRAMLSRISSNCGEGGKVRVMASRFLPGEPVGPFRFRGRRHDDANDHIRHQHRRELRGMTVLASWINHTDLREYNTLDMFQKVSDDRGYLIHNFIDFGATLGSASTGAKMPSSGVEYFIEYPEVALNLVSFGFQDPPYARDDHIPFPSIGGFTERYFEPGSWRPTHPHAALSARTLRDGFWGARLVAAFEDDDIRAVVEAAQLPDENAREELIRVLMARRDLTAKHWFEKVGVLDRFDIDESNENLVVSFFDWRLAGRWKPAHRVSYEWRLRGAFDGDGHEVEGRTPAGATTLQPLSSEAWAEWKEKLVQKQTRRYVYLKLSPVRETVWEPLLHKPERKIEPDGPATEAIFYLQNDGKLSWVGVRRSLN